MFEYDFAAFVFSLSSQERVRVRWNRDHSL
jgi:hypothetical protein